MSLDTPVAFIVFNRPAATRISFEAIAARQPRTLLIVGDGPRTELEGELCAQVRAELLQRIDWTCDLRTRFLAENLGPRYGPATGLDWVFGQVEEAIILEDDCVAGESFFPYCEQLLERYRDDERVMEIGGSNYQFGRWRGDYTYYFSKHAHTHGWATWRRAWAHYDVDVRAWPELKRAGLVEAWCDDPKEARYWTAIFDGVHAGGFSTWDYQWVLARWAHHGLAAVPNRNLVTNIGHGPDATHTQARLNFLEMPIENIEALRHPPHVIPDSEADRYMFETIFAGVPMRGTGTPLSRLAGRVREWLTKPAARG